MYGSSLTLPSGSLLSGTTYSVSVTVTNFLGVQSAPALRSFNVSSLPLPLLAIQGPEVAVLYGYQLAAQYVLSSQVALSSCWAAGNQQLLFRWSDTRGNASNVISGISSLNSTSLAIPTALLEMGKMYTFTLTATAQADASLAVSASASLYMAVPPLLLSSQTPTTISVATVSSFSMSASLQDPSLSALSHFSWLCQTSSGQVCFNQKTGKTLSLASCNTSCALSANQLSADSYKFSVTATYTTTSGSITQSNALNYSVHVSASPIPSVQLSILSPLSASTTGTILPGSMLSLQTTAQLPDGTRLLDGNLLVAFIWTVTGPNTPLFDIAGIGLFSSNSTLNLNQLRAANYFNPGSTYTYTVQVTYISGLSLLSTSASITLTTQLPPSQGTLMVHPMSGVSLNTTFTLNAANWAGQTALSYSFYTYQANSVGTLVQVPLSSFSPAASVTLSYLAAGNLTLGVTVRDLYNTTSTFEVAGVILTHPAFLSSSSRRLLATGSNGALISSLSAALASGVAAAATVLDGNSVLQLLLVVQSELLNVTVDSTVQTLVSQMMSDLQTFAPFCSASQVASTLSSIAQLGAFTVDSAATAVSVLLQLLASGTLTYTDYTQLMDTLLAAQQLLTTENSQFSFSAISSAIVATLAQLQTAELTGDGSYWSDASYGSSALVYRFNALSSSGANLTLTNSTLLRPTLPVDSPLAMDANTGVALVDARVVQFASSGLSGINTTEWVAASSQAIKFDLAFVNGTAITADSMTATGLSFQLQLLLEMEEAQYANLCPTNFIQTVGGWVCVLQCAVYDETQQVISKAVGCSVEVGSDADGGTVATLSASGPGVYTAAMARSYVAPVVAQLSSSAAAAPVAASSSTLTPSSITSSSSTASSATSSTFPFGSIAVNFTINNVDVSNLTAFVANIAYDVSFNLARESTDATATPASIESYVTVLSVGGVSVWNGTVSGGTSRRLLQLLQDVAVVFMLSSAVSQQLSGAEPVAKLVASFAWAAANNALLTPLTNGIVPSQTISFSVVGAQSPVPSSSSSTGSLQATQPISSSGPHSSSSNVLVLGLGLGLGVGLGVPLLFLAVTLLVVLCKHLRWRSPAHFSSLQHAAQPLRPSSTAHLPPLSKPVSVHPTPVQSQRAAPRSPPPLRNPATHSMAVPTFEQSMQWQPRRKSSWLVDDDEAAAIPRYTPEADEPELSIKETRIHV